MVKIRRILCPTDFSDGSRHALEHAMVIAGWYGSQIFHATSLVSAIGSRSPFPP